jgi:predicted AAA+ superfamily ATPase
MKKNYPRWQITVIKERLKTRRIVVIAGPHQCGKTTLAKQVMTKKDSFRTLDDENVHRAAINGPLDFAKHNQGTLIIDEVQKAPQLIPAIKMVVDDNNTPGQFLLTGSADIQSLPAVSESLAGRVSHIRLRPLSVGEILGKKPTFLDASFKHIWPTVLKGYDKAAILELAFRGGYPEAVKLGDKERRYWHLDYAESILRRDLKQIANIQRQSAMEELLSVLSAWSGKLMDINAICSKFGVDRKTLVSYINILVSLFLFERVFPWVNTDYERTGRREKIYITDTGLMASLLNYRLDDILLDHDRSGKIIETFVFNQLAALCDLEKSFLFRHYRDRTGREIDFVIENDRGEILGIGVKSSSSYSASDARHLRWFRQNIVKDKPFVGLILYTGENTLSLGNDIYAVPIAALWN